MATKKQRRRDAKSRRHEYEYVYVDDEGNEVAVDSDELRQERDAKREARPRRVDAGKAPARGRRTIEPPSWRKSTRRALIFGPLLIVAMVFLNRNLTLVQQVLPALFLIAFFIPFSYFTDSLAYRMYQKRLARQNPNAKTR
jgi:Flp pilus assembly protein TadB